MAFYRFFFLLFLLHFTNSHTPIPTFTTSQTSSHTFNHTDTEAAIVDIRSKAYYGFAILLLMFYGTSQPNRELTFFMPSDKQLSAYPISADRLEDFVLRHSINMPLHFNDLAHFPSGTLVPSGVRDRMITIHNRGRGNFFVNNAKVIAPNICVHSIIKCHGIDSVIEYGKSSSSDKVEVHEDSADQAIPPMDSYYAEAPMSTEEAL